MANKKLNVWVLTALVVGNMVGSAIFMLPSSLAKVASPGGAMLAWGLTGVGVLFIALVYGILSIKKPDISGGPQVYAKALFKDGTSASNMMGYFVTWGYWVANFAGNVAVITTFAGYLSSFLPIMNSGAVVFKMNGLTITLGHFLNFLVCSALLWFVYFLILRGVEGAGNVNLVATAAKVIGFALFIVATLFVFQASHLVPFAVAKAGDGGQTIGLFGQASQAALTTLWAFVGIESAVVFSARAKSGRDIKRATIIGLIIALVIYAAITILVMGTLTQSELVHSTKPLVDALSKVIGPAGADILGFLALISLFGSSIGWILLSSEVPYQSAKKGCFLKMFTKTNASGTPVRALLITCIMGQFFILSTILRPISDAFDFVIRVATLSYLIPYIFAAVYLLKLVAQGDGYLGRPKARITDGIIGGIAAIYSLWVIKAGTGDLNTFYFGIGMIFSGVVFYPLVQKYFHRVENGLENPAMEEKQ